MTNLFNKTITIIQDRTGECRTFNKVVVDNVCISGSRFKDDKDTVFSEKEKKTVLIKKLVDVQLNDYVSFDFVNEDIENAFDFANAKKSHEGFTVSNIVIYDNGMKVDHIEVS